ncbi:MAG: ABC transporter permease [Planctomycetes bacterium]|nr:ABC transporter permease [Planctomycetota bacterium]
MGDRLAAWVSGIADRVFGPVFTLDATRVGRRLSTFLIRWAFLLIVFAVLGLFYSDWHRDLSTNRGVVHPSVLTRFAENFFWVYSATQFLIIATLTPAFTAGAITDEKERKTLHFLLVTDLTGREIVFGKLAARIGALLTLVIAGLPIVSFLQFFGGIEPLLLLVSVSMTSISVVSLTAVSMAASVLMARTRDALLLAYAVPAAYVYLSVSALSGFSRSSDPELRALAEAFSVGNPFYVADKLDRGIVGEIPSVAVWYVVFHAVVAVVGIAFAALRIRAAVRREGAAATAPKGRPARMLAWVLGKRSKARHHPRVSDQPIAWREMHVEPGSSAGLFHRLFTIGILAAIFLPFLGYIGELLFYDSSYYSRYARGSWTRFQEDTKVWVCAVTCVFGLLMMLRATVRGASSVAGERDRDTWVSLIGTSLSVREILHGKWAGCVWGQRDAMILLGVVWTIGVVTFSINPLALIPTAVALGAYLNAFAWLGIWCSASARSSRIAIGHAVPYALFLGGGYWFVLGCCCAGASFGMRGGDGEVLLIPMGFVAGLTPAISLALTPAIGLEVLHDMPSRSWGGAFAYALGMGLGIVGWMWLAAVWADSAHDKFAHEANRDEEIPGATPRRPIYGPHRATLHDSSDTEDST